MLNQVILVGQVIRNPTLKELGDGKKVSSIELEVKRNYKNTETGNYDSDIITCTLWEGIATNAVEHLDVGSTVGIKARLDTSKGDVEIIAEKITFINTK